MSENDQKFLSNRQLPRPFEFHWGKGMVVEEASIDTPYHEPTVQLLEYENGEVSIRFCYYKGSQFGRGSLLMDEISIEEMREALQYTPRLKKFLARLIS